MTPETLSLLTARAANLNGVSGGGTPSITPADVACALAGTSRSGTLLALYRYVGDKSAQPQLFYQAWMRAVDVANREGWCGPKGQEMTKRMTKVAIVETIDQPVCRSCGGTGYLGAKLCHRCQGSGQNRFSDSTVARALGVDKSNYSRTWKPRYQSVNREIGGWVCRLDSEVRYQIKNW